MSVRAIIAALILTLPALAQSKNIREDIDPYTKRRTLFLEVPTRACPGDPPVGFHDPEVHLLFTASETPDRSVLYFVTAELDHGHGLNLSKNGTMNTLTDGVPGLLSTPAGSTVVTAYWGDRSYLHETIPFAVTIADLETLSHAAFFQFRVNGPRQAVQRCVEGRRFHDLPEFLSAASDY
jgi:hypothetical protein